VYEMCYINKLALPYIYMCVCVRMCVCVISDFVFFEHKFISASW